MKKTRDEEEAIFESIENVSHNLKDQVGELQKFINEFKVTRQRIVIRPQSVRDSKGGAQYE